MIPAFDQRVCMDGYAWWYIDAISDDGRHGLTAIAFIGSVFSPYYAWARDHGNGDPLNHCAINVALYGPGGRWSMTERGRSAVERDRVSLTIGPSAMAWNGHALTLSLNEWSVPIPRRIRGQIKIRPTVSSNETIDLDAGGLHRWTPVWPSARVEMNLQDPDLRWSGSGYFDHNSGDEPLSRGFDSWSWSRATTRRGPVILYDTRYRNGQHASLAVRFDRSGKREAIGSPPAVDLPNSHWGIARPTRSDNGRARIEAVWEDTPFYARSKISAQLFGESVSAVHESLSLRRFCAPWVQLMLPFRMPRRST